MRKYRALGALGVALALSPQPAGSTLPWTETVLASFTSQQSGMFPVGVPLADRSGALYGMTQTGGPSNACDGGCGTVFKLTPPASGGAAWTRSVLYAFAGYAPTGSDGAEPLAGLIPGASGALYGTTYQGGVQTPNAQGGVVFELTPPASAGNAWTENVLYAFSGKDGLLPSGGLIAGAGGALYGMTEAGGPFDDFKTSIGYGVVFKLTPPPVGTTGWTESVLYAFTGSADRPQGSLIANARGALYGCTSGNVFKLTPPARGSTAWSETVLHSFSGGADGGSPQGSLIIDGGGALYGTAAGGGAHGKGIVFKLIPPHTGSTAWSESVLYSFRGGQDGNVPTAGLVANAWGTLYGTTQQGGNLRCPVNPTGCGTVFRLVPSANAWSETVLYAFSGGTDGYYPNGVTSNGRGILSGATCCGGSASGGGTVFELSESAGFRTVQPGRVLRFRASE